MSISAASPSPGVPSSMCRMGFCRCGSSTLPAAGWSAVAPRRPEEAGRQAEQGQRSGFRDDADGARRADVAQADVVEPGIVVALVVAGEGAVDRWQRARKADPAGSPALRVPQPSASASRLKSERTTAADALVRATLRTATIAAATRFFFISLLPEDAAVRQPPIATGGDGRDGDARVRILQPAADEPGTCRRRHAASPTPVLDRLPHNSPAPARGCRGKSGAFVPGAQACRRRGSGAG
ncbi:MAG: hypothetical protein AW12_01104 [Candidatus Accumulibacter sp. BA-94]|nr:MAG: hypothetical protein AW12_01104 [Candidatus Accumulibacter sp. BA-94]